MAANFVSMSRELKKLIELNLKLGPRKIFDNFVHTKYIMEIHS